MSTGFSPFPRRPIPVLGESVYGFERRLAVCARYDSLGAFRRATGLLDLTPASVPTKFARLAMLAGLDPRDLDSMRWAEIDGNRKGRVVSILGHSVRSWHLRTECLRFCPACLSEDGPPEQRIHRQAWQVLQVCACPRHRILLAESCDQCREPIAHSRKTKPWACACGRDLTDIATAAAPEGAAEISSAIMRKLSPNMPELLGPSDSPGSLPQPFDDLPLEALLTGLSKIGALASAPPEDDTPVGPKEKVYSGVPIERAITCAEAAYLMEGAYLIVHSWPAGMNPVFSSIANRNPRPEQDHPVRSIFATRTGYRLLGPIKSVEGAIIRVIDDALGDWLLRERGIYIDGQQRPKTRQRGDIGIDAADALRRLEGRVSHPLGISHWAAAGAVQMVGKKVSLRSVEATSNAIANLKSADFDDTIPAEDWSTRFLYNEHYRRADAIRDVLAGKIRVQRDQEGTAGLASIQICRSDLLLRIASAREGKRSPARAGRARQRDSFRRAGKIHALLSDLWPDHEIPDVTKQPGVRCITSAKRYYGRDMKQRKYSVVDALDLMEAQVRKGHALKRNVAS